MLRLEPRRSRSRALVPVDQSEGVGAVYGKYGRRLTARYSDHSVTIFPCSLIVIQVVVLVPPQICHVLRTRSAESMHACLVLWARNSRMRLPTRLPLVCGSRLTRTCICFSHVACSVVTHLRWLVCCIYFVALTPCVRS